MNGRKQSFVLSFARSYKEPHLALSSLLLIWLPVLSAHQASESAGTGDAKGLSEGHLRQWKGKARRYGRDEKAREEEGE